MKKRTLTLIAGLLLSLNATAANLTQMPNDFLGCWTNGGHTNEEIYYHIKPKAVLFYAFPLETHSKGKILSISSKSNVLKVKTKHSIYYASGDGNQPDEVKIVTENMKLINKKTLMINNNKFTKRKCD